MIHDITFHNDGNKFTILDWEGEVVEAGHDMDGEIEIISGNADPREVEQALIEYNRYYSPS